MVRSIRPVVAAGLTALLLAACSDGAPAPEAEETAVPRQFASPAARPNAVGRTIGTPMDQRVATLGLLNKRNNISQDLQLRPGEARRVGDVVVRLAACERTAPWEPQGETGAFVQVLVLDRAAAGAEEQWRGIFSGWLFRNSPSLNVVEHPIYDVWVKDCAMSFPGEEATPTPRRSGAPAASARPAPPPAPAPSPVAAPAAEEPAPEASATSAE